MEDGQLAIMQQHLDFPALFAVASFTQQLDVALGVAPALHDRDDMVKFEALLTAAFHATTFIPSPNKLSHGFHYSLTLGSRNPRQVFKSFNSSLDLLNFTVTSRELVFDAELKLLVGNCACPFYSENLALINPIVGTVHRGTHRFSVAAGIKFSTVHKLADRILQSFGIFNEHDLRFLQAFLLIGCLSFAVYPSRFLFARVAMAAAVDF
jgi:hypothetical protein